MTGGPILTTTIQVRFADLDVLGHVNNVQFLAFMETARVRFLSEHARGLRGGLMVAQAECDYRREIPGSTKEVEVTVSVVSVGRTSFRIRHVIEDAGVEVAVGHVVLVAIGPDRRPRPITDDERAVLLGPA